MGAFKKCDSNTLVKLIAEGTMQNLVLLVQLEEREKAIAMMIVNGLMKNVSQGLLKNVCTEIYPPRCQLK